MKLKMPKVKVKLPSTQDIWKSNQGSLRSMMDPLDLGMGFEDKIFGAKKGPDYSAQDKARQEAIDEYVNAGKTIEDAVRDLGISADEYTRAQKQAATDLAAAGKSFADGGPAKYSTGNKLALEQQGRSELAGIKTDSRYKDAEMAALKALEERSTQGITAADRADMFKMEQESNRANRGRQQAIQQNMAARGMGGSGMELLAAQQSAQDATEMQALRDLERAGSIQDRKQSAALQLGSLGSQLQSKDFEQQAQQRRAQDQINQFNTSIANTANAQNWDRENTTADKNTTADYDHRRNVYGTAKDNYGANTNAADSAFKAGGAKYQGQKDRYGMQTGNATMKYDWQTDQKNEKQLQERDAANGMAGKFGAAGGIAGGILGGIFGGPGGAAAGSQTGSAVGGQMGRTKYGNDRYYSDENCKKDIKTEKEDAIEAFLSAIKPKEYKYKNQDAVKHGVVAQDLERSKVGSSLVSVDESGMKTIDVPDAIGALLQAVSYLHKNKKNKG
jgi:hypothetical protein